MPSSIKSPISERGASDPKQLGGFLREVRSVLNQTTRVTAKFSTDGTGTNYTAFTTEVLPQYSHVGITVHSIGTSSDGSHYFYGLWTLYVYVPTVGGAAAPAGAVTSHHADVVSDAQTVTYSIGSDDTISIVVNDDGNEMEWKLWIEVKKRRHDE